MKPVILKTREVSHFHAQLVTTYAQLIDERNAQFTSRSIHAINYEATRLIFIVLRPIQVVHWIHCNLITSCDRQSGEFTVN